MAKSDAILDITAQRSSLMRALGAASRAASGKIIACLNGMYIECGDAGPGVWFATDVDIWRGGKLDIESVITPGAALLPVAQVAAMLKSCADGLVRLTFSVKDVQIKAGGLTAKIQTMNVIDFPPRPVVPPGGVSLPVIQFARIIANTEPTSGATESKYFMRGAYFSVGDGEVICVSTNGHQLSKSAAPYEHSAVDAVQTILPKPSLVELSAMLDGAKSVRYVSDIARHYFVVDEEILVSRSIDDKFPEWRRIVPQSHETRVVCKRIDWLDVMKRVLVASDIESRRVAFSIERGKMTIHAFSAKGGEATEQLTIDQQGKDIKVWANGAYVRHFLETATSERVSLEIKDQKNAFLFQPEETAPEVGGADYLYVLAPMSETGA